MAGFFSALLAFVIGFAAPTSIEISPPPPVDGEQAASHVSAYNASAEKIMPNGANPNAIDHARPLVFISPTSTPTPTPTPIVVIAPPDPDPIIDPIGKPIPIPTYGIDPPPVDTIVHGRPSLRPNSVVSESY